MELGNEKKLKELNLKITYFVDCLLYWDQHWKSVKKLTYQYRVLIMPLEVKQVRLFEKLYITSECVV